MFRIAPLFSVLLLFFACSNPVKTEDTPKNDSPTASDTLKHDAAKSTLTAAVATIVPEVMPNYPDSMDGCGDYYSFDTTSLKKEQFIFLSNAVSVGIIQVGGKLIYMRKDNKASTFGGKHSSSVFEGNDYKVILDITEEKQLEDGAKCKGTLEINHKGIKT